MLNTLYLILFITFTSVVSTSYIISAKKLAQEHPPDDVVEDVLWLVLIVGDHQGLAGVDVEPVSTDYGLQDHAGDLVHYVQPEVVFTL